MSGQVAVSRVDRILGSVIVPENRSKRASNVSVRKKVLVKKLRLANPAERSTARPRSSWWLG